jgi:2-amino-4-hydroxy-6-hydroxymethyldihydropteridine diphosphokinase
MLPDPSSTSPSADTVDAMDRTRPPNDSSGVRSSAISAVAPARAKPAAWRSALARRIVAKAVASGPEPGPAPGWRMTAATRVTHASLPSGGPPILRRVRAYIGLGANLGDSGSTIAGGIRALATLPDTRLHGVSRLYATAPVGFVEQPWFRNAVVALDVPAGSDPSAGAIALLVGLKGLERAFGRQERERWGPRELDLDLLVFGRARLTIDRPPEGVSLDSGKADRLLVVPHRDAGERLFVLAPFADIASAAALRRRVEGPEAVRPVATWDGERSAWAPIADEA